MGAAHLIKNMDKKEKEKKKKDKVFDVDEKREIADTAMVLFGPSSLKKVAQDFEFIDRFAGLYHHMERVYNKCEQYEHELAGSLERQPKAIQNALEKTMDTLRHSHDFIHKESAA